MARPCKTGLDFFSFDCVLDDKLRLIEAEFGSKGFTVVVKLWQKIYRDKGYYCEWNDDLMLLFATDEVTDCGVNLVNEIVLACIRRHIFSKELYEKYHILTSRGIQKRYAMATAERKRVDWKKEYLLIDVPKNSVISADNSINPPNNSINPPNNPQSKGKESKRKKSRGNNIVPSEISSAFSAFVEMRKKIKKPLTDYAIELSIKKLEGFAPGDYPTQIAILNQSIEHCWQGLFPLKEDSNGIHNRDVKQNESPGKHTGTYI